MNKWVYIVNFPIDGNSGKNKATREKANALKAIVGEQNFTFIHGKRIDSVFDKVWTKLTFDLSVFFKLLPKKDFVVVQRVIFLPLTTLLFRLKGIKVASEFHADFREEIPLLNKSGFSKFILHIVAYFYNLNFHLSTGIIYNHPYLKRKFDPVFKKPSIYSYNGANYKDFIPMDRDQSRLKLDIEEDKKILLFLGSVSQWHGVDLLIDIFNEERIIERKDLYLYIVGVKDNAYVRNLKNAAKNKNIIFVDAVDTAKATLYINAADLCLLPVKQVRTSPGSPLKLYDYISCGKPILTQTSLAGYSDEVLNYNLGFVTDFTNRDLASKDIVKIMEDDKLEDFEENNRTVASSHVSWGERMNNWVRFVNAL